MYYVPICLVILSHPLCSCFIIEAIPIPADQPIMQIKDLDEVVIPTMEIKVKKMDDMMQFPKKVLYSVDTLAIHKYTLFNLVWTLNNRAI